MKSCWVENHENFWEHLNKTLPTWTNKSISARGWNNSVWTNTNTNTLSKSLWMAGILITISGAGQRSQHNTNKKFKLKSPSWCSFRGRIVRICPESWCQNGDGKVFIHKGFYSFLKIQNTTKYKQNCKIQVHKCKIQSYKRTNKANAQELPGMFTFSLTLWRFHQTLEIPWESQQKSMMIHFIY